MKKSSLRSIIAMTCLAAAATAHADTYEFNIRNAVLSDALKEFASQSGLQVVYFAKIAANQSATPVSGALSAEEALNKLLAPSNLTFERIDAKTIAIRDPAAERSRARNAGGVRTISSVTDQSATALRVALRDTADGSSGPAAADQFAESTDGMVAEIDTTRVKGIPEILVTGSRGGTLNADIQRSRDDTQPYVIMDREMIERSGARNLEEFFKQRLPMNTVSYSNSQYSGFDAGNQSTIDLRGLGANQTLILVDGRRTVRPSPGAGTPLVQSDINGIPLSAIERIEVLPTTASGIYGGGATGGVINIVLRRNWQGSEVNLTYDNTFDSDSAIRSIELSTGFTLEGGRTQVLMSGGYSDRNVLEVGDRNYLARGRAAVVANYGNDESALDFAGIWPPLGATPNVSSVTGQPLFGPGTPSYTFVPRGYTGGGGLAPFIENAGHYNLAPAATAQSFGGGREGLLSAPTLKTGMITVRREFSPRVDVFVEASASENIGRTSTNSEGIVPFLLPASAQNNPFGQDVWVRTPIAEADATREVRNSTLRVAGGAIFQLPGRWQLSTEYTWGRARYEADGTWSLPSTIPEITNGTLDVLTDPFASNVDFSPYLSTSNYSSPFDSVLHNGTVRVAGPMMTLPGGPIWLSAMVERRKETLSDGYIYGSSYTLYVPSRSQDTTSAYLEARVPLIGAPNAMPGAQELELQLAGRWDGYTVNSSSGYLIVPVTEPIARARNDNSSLNPTLGIRFRPVSDVILRASYGTGFLAPAVDQLTPAAPTQAGSGWVDNKRGNGPIGGFVVTSGGNPNLKSEKSESWSAGVVLTPRWAEGFRASLDYTRIEKSEGITSLHVQQILDNEDILPGRVTRGPRLDSDPTDWAGPVTALDASFVNLSRLMVEAYDLALDYRLEAGRFGVFDLSAVGTLQTSFKTQIIPTAPDRNMVGITGFNPLKLRLNGSVTWRYGDTSVAWSARYLDSYLVADPESFASEATFISQGSRQVSSQMYHDAVVSYRFPGSPAGTRPGGLGAILENAEVQLGIRNVFDKEPPFDAGNQNHYYSLFGDPRLRSYYLSLKRSF